VTGSHPHAEQVYAALRARGCAPPLPREYGLYLVSETLRAADHIRLLETPKDKP